MKYHNFLCEQFDNILNNNVKIVLKTYSNSVRATNYKIKKFIKQKPNLT